MTGACQSILIGHEGEISKVAFNPQGIRILTASSDKTARLWDAETGDCLQVRPFILFNYRSWCVDT
jgi:dynein assembly factor with WDR repeat domains 1